MPGRIGLVRTVVAAAGVLGGLLLGLTASEAQADPGPCGYVKVSKDSTTTSVTLVEYCPRSDCTGGGDGPAFYQPPMTAMGMTVEAYVCVALP